ncbi:hypothetical protein FGG08_003179 [Glutinoglossum americanum]|uniref:Mso1 N-terminal domain-containing protein n=1 Tax=Glutinoglossum americanum TaxID=1670608 RepID=A0A9P8I347_9PEZI|nr:hypothetical protein FGG08_003179 [Glutinoglossum americanum]
MSSYLTSILTTTTSRYTSLKRSLIPDEKDGDTEDDSHISRVLRAYYTEKGRPFPQWLPPDPKAPQPPPPQPMYLNTPAVSSGAGRGAPMGRGGVLSDIWDPPAQQSGPPHQEESLSLRRGGRGGPGRMQHPPHSAPPTSGGIVDSYPKARPLPSQRAGSYQSQFSQQSSTSQGQDQDNYSPPPSSSGSGVSAQERLKARLWGGGNAAGRSASPTGSQNSVGTGSGRQQTQGYTPPNSAPPGRSSATSSFPPPSISPGRQPAKHPKNSAYNPPPTSLTPGRPTASYDQRPSGPGALGGGGGGYGSSNNNNTSSNAYNNRSQPGGYTSGGGDGGGYKPYVGSSAPWSTGEEDFNTGGGAGDGYGYGGGARRPQQPGRGYSEPGSGGSGGRIVGLPSGPRYK